MIAITSFLRSWAELLAAISATLIALGIIAKSPIGKLVKTGWERLFGTPGAEWFAKNVIHSIQPSLDLIRKENTEQHHAAQKERVDGEARLSRLICEHQHLTEDHINKNAEEHAVFAAALFPVAEALVPLVAHITQDVRVTTKDKA